MKWSEVLTREKLQQYAGNQTQDHCGQSSLGVSRIMIAATPRKVRTIEAGGITGDGTEALILIRYSDE